MGTRRSRRSLTTFAVLVLSAITLIALSLGTSAGITSSLRSVGSTVLSPLVDVVNAATRPIGNFFSGALNYGAVTSENQKLQAQVDTLQQQRLIEKYERQQLAQINALQGLGFVGSIPTVTAQTINLNVSNFAASIEINQGSSSGVAVGMPVVGSGGLVGQVVIVSHSTATVRLIDDGLSRVGAQVGTSSVQGIINGVSSNRSLTLNYIAPNSAVSKGAVVYTNGLQGAEFPAGLPIGKVTSVVNPQNATQMVITVAPLANLKSLGYVDVLLWEPPA
jgi:rod shape-determining protein MreC